MKFMSLNSLNLSANQKSSNYFFFPCHMRGIPLLPSSPIVEKGNIQCQHTAVDVHKQWFIFT